MLLKKWQRKNVDCLWPEIWILYKQQINQSPKLVAVGKVRRDRLVFSKKNIVFNLSKVSSRKRSLKRANLIKNAAESKQVASGVARLAIPNFRSDVAGNG